MKKAVKRRRRTRRSVEPRAHQPRTRRRPASLPENLFDDYVMERIDYQANRLSEELDLTREDRRDLRQDMAVELLIAAKRFRRQRSQWHTFACGVLKMYALRLLVARQREADRSLPMAADLTSLDAFVCDTVVDPHDDLDDVERRLDVETVLATMPPRMRAMCELLKTGASISAIARKLGVHRNAIYRLKDRARTYFRASGVDFS